MLIFSYNWNHGFQYGKFIAYFECVMFALSNEVPCLIFAELSLTNSTHAYFDNFWSE